MNRFILAGILSIFGGFQQATVALADSPDSQPMTLTIEIRASSPEPDVRVTIVNTTGAVLNVYAVRPRNLIDIIVHDSRGNIVQPTKNVLFTYSTVAMSPIVLQPGQSYTVGANDPDLNRGWIPLTNWGYPDLQKGSYTISARPGFYLGGRADIKPYSDSETKLRPTANANLVSVEL